ncbi:hypothetical protein BHC46_04845 [Snodgrassella alvi]|uniref:Uncharacterized protein n=1 Tax=Snodgrassella alvi TaxID=1196083 RepID=A0A2N9XH32_9NEIS|nr:hypothetical protein BHC46_04845 [Snodgrassella alvi]
MVHAFSNPNKFQIFKLSSTNQSEHINDISHNIVNLQLCSSFAPIFAPENTKATMLMITTEVI